MKIQMRQLGIALVFELPKSFRYFVEHEVRTSDSIVWLVGGEATTGLDVHHQPDKPTQPEVSHGIWEDGNTPHKIVVDGEELRFSSSLPINPGSVITLHLADQEIEFQVEAM
ncbi:MAG: hypothetical protein AAB443_01415 [Patescibacteria group bacterium]